MGCRVKHDSTALLNNCMRLKEFATAKPLTPEQAKLKTLQTQTKQAQQRRKQERLRQQQQKLNQQRVKLNQF